MPKDEKKAPKPDKVDELEQKVEEIKAILVSRLGIPIP